MPTIEDIFNYVFTLRQEIAKRDQMIQGLQGQLKEKKKPT